MKDDYSKTMSLMCTTCGGKDFEFEDDEGPFRCIGCDRTFGRHELIHENGESIESELEEVKSKIVSDIEKDFAKIFKKFR
jgi:hypothetical protein